MVTACRVGVSSVVIKARPRPAPSPLATPVPDGATAKIGSARHGRGAWESSTRKREPARYESRLRGTRAQCVLRTGGRAQPRTHMATARGGGAVAHPPPMAKLAREDNKSRDERTTSRKIPASKQLDGRHKHAIPPFGGRQRATPVEHKSNMRGPAGRVPRPRKRCNYLGGMPTSDKSTKGLQLHMNAANPPQQQRQQIKAFMIRTVNIAPPESMHPPRQTGS